MAASEAAIIATNYRKLLLVFTANITYFLCYSE